MAIDMKSLNDKKLSLSGGTMTGSITMGGSSTLTVSYNYGIKGTKSDGSSDYIMYVDNGNKLHIGYTSKFPILLDGNTTSNGTVTCSDCITTSDERLKKDILKIENPLYKIEQLNGYTFLKDGDLQRTTGLLAQEVLEVLPEAVFTREDGYYGVSYGNIVGLLIEAIKELHNEIKVLKGELNG